MTERLYYTDPYLTEFEATIVGVGAAPDERPGTTAVFLDRTAFYPTSGGQPFDTGRLGDARVVDVIDQDDGRVLHVVEGVVAEGPVRGHVDWERRFEHMQQHTGQHVLSAAFDGVLKVKTLSFHLGSSTSTIDLSREVSAGEIARVESEANRIVWEDRPVSIRFAGAAEAAALPLRKASVRQGELRIIEVEGFDVSACGGTHVARTGAIGIIAVVASERFRGGSRIEFACGTRALRSYRELRDSLASATRLLSVLPAEVPAGIARVQGEAKELRRSVKDLQTKLASFEADSLAQRAEVLAGARIVLAALDGLDANGLKTIASHIAARAGHVAILVSAAAPAQVIVARASDVTLDGAALLRQLVEKFGGKGGGRPELAQGGGLQGAGADVISLARSLIAGR